MPRFHPQKCLFYAIYLALMIFGSTYILNSGVLNKLVDSEADEPKGYVIRNRETRNVHPEPPAIKVPVPVKDGRFEEKEPERKENLPPENQPDMQKIQPAVVKQLEKEAQLEKVVKPPVVKANKVVKPPVIKDNKQLQKLINTPALPEPAKNVVEAASRQILAKRRRRRYHHNPDPLPNNGTPEPYIELGESELDRQIAKSYPEMKNGKFISPRRVVHFDLKGAPPRVSYFKEVFPLLKKLGANGVLLEWEDMFPFTGILNITRNDYAYSESDFKEIMQSAKDAGLEIIPLLQTFGHLEWILKLAQFAHIREHPSIPLVICFGMEEAWSLVKEAINQIATAHKPYGLPYFHIGADEAFQIGQCEPSRKVMAEQGGRQRVILWHISRVAQYLRDTHNTRVLAWHDMFANSNPSDLHHYKMPQLIEPVLWSYAEDLNYYLPSRTWDALAPFQMMWGASSFKGADGPSRYYANPNHYIKNHLGWVSQMTQNHKRFKQFRGIILTGWSRFDHLALLCEILPVGFPSLAFNLQILANGTPSTANTFQQLLNCRLEPDRLVTAGCNFPGARIYELIQNFKQMQDSLRAANGVLDDYQIKGWLSRTAKKYGFSSNHYLNAIRPRLAQTHAIFKNLRDNLQKEMLTVFFPDTVEEFLYQYIDEEIENLDSLMNTLQTLSGKMVYGVRPRLHLPDTTTTTKSTTPATLLPVKSQVKV